MFGQKDGSISMRNGSTTLIARGTEVQGEIRFSGTLEVEGVVNGNIVAHDDAEEATVRIQPSGQVCGDLVAPVVVVNSQVQGNIYSSRRIELAESAVVTGDVHYQIIEMVKGAQVNGNLLYSPKAKAAELQDSPEVNDPDTVMDN